MKYKLPSVKAVRPPARWKLRLGYLLHLLAFLVIPPPASAQQPPAPPQLSGQEIVALAAVQMTQHPSLEAKMRQRVGIREQYMVGSGPFCSCGMGRTCDFAWNCGCKSAIG